MMPGRRSMFAMFLLAIATEVASAQTPPSIPTRITVGGAFILSQPKETFADNVGNGLGAGANVTYNVLRSGLLAMRFDVADASYGKEERQVPLSATVGSRILLDLTTRNSITTLSWG